MRVLSRDRALGRPVLSVLRAPSCEGDPRILALTLAEKLGMRPLAARCHLALGRLSRRLGDVVGSRPHLDTARALLEAMQMRYWLDRLRLDKISPD